MLCSDRDAVLTADSLQYLSSAGKAEVVKLMAEKVPSTSTSSSSHKKDDSSSNHARISSDSARRQRVEELTRFFMEAKSDIEFALSGGGERRRDLRATSAAELELNDDDRDMMDSSSSSDNISSSPMVLPPPLKPFADEIAGDSDDSPSSSTPLLPRPPSSGGAPLAAAPKLNVTVPVHFQLLEDPVDSRVFHPLLLSIRETDPLLYGTIVCHPLVTGQDFAPKKQDSKRGKKKKQRSSTTAASTPAKAKKADMYHPDFSLPPLTAEDTALNLARFIARAIADRSMQGLLLVVKVMSSYPWHDKILIPVGSHLLSGQMKPPSPPPPPSVEKTMDSSMDFITSVMELEGQLDPLAALRSRLGTSTI
ncbi:hypothetical protein DYB25_012612 [Aphanomyces astaci]|uniref:Uncharacterized protein n=1 Tax=Aphanomyces astaci TaxID=112090 RepID=A0A397BQW6_APHAT|nr:hypothetical protein DYB25_012612 [Aphanomyces astaci]RHY24311.1 hypothetical protein DYB36_012582 [Aphanomyces astaci]RHY60879.1 hypothetical protein DYB34_012961 [Aphanomyces astaci]RHY71597.1 hypothetical protein DYB30_013061 [Aphanomyces astaci]RHY72841.1 hypothetical protein DYB38_012861 [Aphanomyces astaci]